MSRAWWRDTWLIARRDGDDRLRARSFRVTTLIMIIGAAAAVLIPAAVGKHHTVQTVGVLGSAEPALSEAATEAGRVTGNRVKIIPVASLDSARSELRSGALAAVIADGREVLIKQQQSGGGTSSSAATFSGALAQLVGLVRRLPPDSAQSALTHGIALPIRGVEPAGKSSTTRFTGLAVSLLIYIVILFYGIRLTQSVGEEKTSRVVEVMLATVRPTQLLMGKVLGFAMLAFTQILAIGATYLVCGLAVGSNVIHGTTGGVVLLGVIWLLLGYALYCTAFAAAGSMIMRQADASNASTPLLMPLLLAYILSQGVLFNGATPFYHVLGFIPWTAPIAMPVLFAVGAAPVWQVIVSALITVVAIVASARVAGIVYQRSVMRTGARVKLRKILRERPA
ncbi:MAG: ABC transporter permease [Solirubrobacteraceae bacterium]